MDILELQKRLLAAARAHPPSDETPYAFEKRIMARIAKESLVDAWTIWARLLWRAAASCVAIMLALTLWTLFSAGPNGSGNGGSNENLAVALEDTVMAPLARLEDSW